MSIEEIRKALASEMAVLLEEQRQLDARAETKRRQLAWLEEIEASVSKNVRVVDASTAVVVQAVKANAGALADPFHVGTPGEEGPEAVVQDVHDLGSIDDLALSNRSHNALLNNQITRIHHLVVLSPGELMAMRGLGVVGVRDIERALDDIGMSLTQEAASDGARLDDGGSSRPPLGAPVPVTQAVEFRARRPTIGEQIPAELSALLDDRHVQSVILSPDLVRTILKVMSVDEPTLLRETGYDLEAMLAQTRDTLLLVKRALDGSVVRLVEEVAIALRGVSDSDTPFAVAYLALDGRRSTTLEEVGAVHGVSRERIRQRVSRFLQRAASRKPLLSFANRAVEVLQQLKRPVTVWEWASALPDGFYRSSDRDLRVLRELESLGWLAPNTWTEHRGITMVAAGADRELETLTSIKRYRRTIARARTFGAVRVGELATQLGVSDATARGLLLADPHWRRAGNEWFTRKAIRSTWIGSRVRNALVSLKRVPYDELWRALRRLADRPFVRVGWRMPPRKLLLLMIAEMKRDGVFVNDRQDMIWMSETASTPPESATNRAIREAFGSDGTRVLTVFEIVDAVKAAGLSEASGRVATSASPILFRVRRGIYSLLGRVPDQAEIDRALVRYSQVSL